MRESNSDKRDGCDGNGEACEYDSGSYNDADEGDDHRGNDGMTDMHFLF